MLSNKLYKTTNIQYYDKMPIIHECYLTQKLTIGILKDFLEEAYTSTSIRTDMHRCHNDFSCIITVWASILVRISVAVMYFHVIHVAL